MGFIVLEGGAEFGGWMADPDLRALELAGGLQGRLSIIPAAAAADNNHQQAGENGRRWFKKLGATQAAVLPLIDRVSADNQELAEVLGQSRLIYLLGGFPGYLNQTLVDSLCWRAILAAHQEGAVIAGSSAGAMVLGEIFYDPASQAFQKGMGLVSQTCVLPHYTIQKKTRAGKMAEENPDIRFFGIEEETGLINDGPLGQWKVYGKGTVTVYHKDFFQCYRTGEIVNR
ncbi:MAG: Type 1 glutamine amidotransferase-like domain-containing protein [Thermodesulfobacteriota bacterium]